MPPSSPLPLQLRRRRAADDAFISHLAAQAFAEYDRNAGATTLRLVRGGSTWIACRGEVRLGFAVVTASSQREAELSAIAVEEAARGTGVGTALLECVERALAEAGIQGLGLHTAQANLSALDLFLKYGFRVERRLPRFYRGVFDACAMGKRVGSVAR